MHRRVVQENLSSSKNLLSQQQEEETIEIAGRSNLPARLSGKKNGRFPRGSD